MADKEYNVEKLHKELTAAGLVITGVTSDGRIDWAGEPAEEVLAQAEQILANHTAVSQEEALRQTYREKGLDSETMLFALWGKVMEGDSTAADTVKAAMSAIKAEVTAE